jgi:predicted alpha/beta hydrolase family esterase
MTTRVLFIQGGGEGAHAVDAPLAASLQRALGADYEVRFPEMPDEADPDVATWTPAIAAELAKASGRVILVGHSIGGSLLLRTLADRPIARPIAGLFVLAAPTWDGDRWAFDDLRLPRDLHARVAAIPTIAFYHCRDDDIVPFGHLALHGARIPRAHMRAINRGGHQFDDDLAFVAADIRALPA